MKKRILLFLAIILHNMSIKSAVYKEIALPDWETQLAQSLESGHIIIEKESNEYKIVLLNTDTGFWYIIDKTGKEPIPDAPLSPESNKHMPLVEDFFGGHPHEEIQKMLYRSDNFLKLTQQELVNFPKNIVLHGDTGVGKTELAIRLAEKMNRKIFGLQISCSPYKHGKASNLIHLFDVAKKYNKPCVIFFDYFGYLSRSDLCEKQYNLDLVLSLLEREKDNEKIYMIGCVYSDKFLNDGNKFLNAEIRSKFAHVYMEYPTGEARKLMITKLLIKYKVIISSNKDFVINNPKIAISEECLSVLVNKYLSLNPRIVVSDIAEALSDVRDLDNSLEEISCGYYVPLNLLEAYLYDELISSNKQTLLFSKHDEKKSICTII